MAHIQQEPSDHGHRFVYTLKSLEDFAEDAQRERDDTWEAFGKVTETNGAQVTAALTAANLAKVNVYNVRHYGAKADGLTNDAPAINKAIDAVRYEDGYPAGGGDAIKLGSDLSLGKARPSENIAVRNCYLAGGRNTLQFGSETTAPLRNIRLENIRILRAGKAGTSINANDGSVINGIHYKELIGNVNRP